MERAIRYVPRLAIFLAGIAAGALAGSRREAGGIGSAAAEDLKRSLAGLENRLEAQESANAAIQKRIEERLDEHDAKLANLPSTAQLTAAVEQLLAKTMSSLDERLSTQAHSIDVLKTTVSQTDTLLERVLESLDSLKVYSEPAGATSDASYERPAV